MAKPYPTETFEKLLSKIRNHRNDQIYLTLETCQNVRGHIPEDYQFLLCRGFCINGKHCDRLDVVLQYGIEDEVGGTRSVYEFPKNGKVRLY